MKNKKIKAILSITGYFLLVLALCFVGGLVFHNYYYEQIYVSGSSMAPTLNGDDSEKDGTVVDFGIVDNHKTAINNVKRFSIVSTYYYDDYESNGALKTNPKKKIKRIIALPNETFKIEDSKLYVKENDEFKYIPYTFTIDPSVETADSSKDIGETTLGEDEYWVLGDHRNKSRDCGSFKVAIKKDYICGVLVAIEGQAELKVKQYVCDNCGKVYTAYGKCTACFGSLSPFKCELINKKYQLPKYF